MTQPPIDENTNGRDDARREVAASKRASRRADTLIAEARDALASVRSVRESNHFADKFREIIRGAA